MDDERSNIYANVIGSDLGLKITPIAPLAVIAMAHVLSKQRYEDFLGQRILKQELSFDQHFIDHNLSACIFGC